MKNAIVGAYCLICKRPLSEALSVKLGIGPVCRAKDEMQGVLSFMNAEFDVLKHEDRKYIFIRDIGHHTARSVTNDAEYVIKQLYLEFDITDGTRIFYVDSEGQIDEILHAGVKFRGFKAGHEGVDL